MNRFAYLLIIIVGFMFSLPVDAQLAECKVCGKYLFECKGIHKKKKETVKEKICEECKKPISKCEFNGDHSKEDKEAITSYYVTITSNVPDAILTINGLNFGTVAKPIQRPYLYEGEHTITLTKPGYEDLTEKVFIKANQKTFDFKMKPDASSLNLKGDSLYNNKKYNEALDLYIKAANFGNVDAQYSLAFMYYEGKGTNKDSIQAFNWFKKAAENNRASAQKMIGYFYLNGKIIPKDKEQAVKWYRKAASNYKTWKRINETYTLLKNEYEKEPEKYYKIAVEDMERASLIAIQNNDFAQAVEYSSSGLKLNSSNPIFISNCAAALLFSKEFKDAKKLYKSYQEQHGKKMLEDLERYEKECNIPAECKPQIAEIKAMLMK